MPLLSVGIDPGVSGAVAVFVKGDLTAVVDMPTFNKKVGKKNRREINCTRLMRLLAEVGPHLAYLENVHAMPGQGVTSMFSFGRSLGRIEGVLGALEVDIVYTEPRVWTNKMGVRDKEHAREIAAGLWPTFADTFLNCSKAKGSGRADAALIGLYGLKHKR
jgi:crossover junction endodeoxyribonuclease RuvC